MTLNRTAILDGTSHLGIRKVPTPEWPNTPGHVYVRMLSADEADDVQRLASLAVAGTLTETEANVRWCILGVCDENGQRLFTDVDIDALRGEPLVAIGRCAREVMEVNGVTEEGEKKRSNGRPKTIRIPTRKRTRRS